MSSKCLFFLILSAGIIAVTSGMREFTSSFPELYFAHVAGAITGGVNMMTVGDQTPCSDLPLVDLRYRTMDGRCNHPLDYGMTFRPVKRFMPADYHDGQGHNSPRMFSVEGGVLPSPRLVSRIVHTDGPAVDNTTVMVMQLGQLIDHDITVAPVPTRANGSIICCGIAQDQLPEECFPIQVPADDPVFDTCMEFVRSEAVRDELGNNIFPREQMNALTSFLDGSSIYGSREEILTSLRSDNGLGALLNVRLVNGKERLPPSLKAPRLECIATGAPDSYCQLAGDARVNEQPGLGCIHLTFHKLHNHVVRLLVAGILRKRHQVTVPHIIETFIFNATKDVKEKLFQEARKIVGGIFQKIVYCEYLPVILGPDLIAKFKLGCERRSRYNKYVDPRVEIGFLSAAFRFGHTLIPNTFLVDGQRIELKANFMRPEVSLRNYDSIMSSLVTTGKEEAYDRYMASAITEHLFETSRGPKGKLDLMSLNIQRGRDHGLPAYFYWRRYYGLRRITTFDELGEAGELLKSVYKHILDVDLFPAGTLEPSVPGGVVGETFGHIIANQFADIKFGDQYFFLSAQDPQGFTDDQIQAIFKTSLNSVLCQNTEMEFVQVNPFFLPSEINPNKPCSDYPDLNVEPWMLYF